MSKRVLLVCILLLLMGVNGALGILRALMHGQVALNVSVLFLPAGIALTLALPGARVLADFAFFASYLVLALLLAAPLFGSTGIGVSIFGVTSLLPPTFPVVLVIVALAGTILGLLHWMVRSPVFDEHLGG